MRYRKGKAGSHSNSALGQTDSVSNTSKRVRKEREKRRALRDGDKDRVSVITQRKPTYKTVWD